MAKITIEGRVEAACEATEIRLMLKQTALPYSAFAPFIWDIAYQAKQQKPNIGKVRHAIEGLLALKLEVYWHTAWVRLHCANIEAGFGIAHSEETKAAFAAWDDDRGGGKVAWDAYCEQFKAPDVARATPCMNSGFVEVRAEDGGCLRCDADQGESCR